MVERRHVIKHFCMSREHLCCSPDLTFVLNTEGNYASADNRAFQMPLAVCMLHHTLISDSSFRKSCRHGTCVIAITYSYGEHSPHLEKDNSKLILHHSDLTFQWKSCGSSELRQSQSVGKLSAQEKL